MGTPTPHEPHQPNDPTPTSGAIHAPWRLEYMESIDREKDYPGAPKTGASGSFIRDYWLDPANDVKNGVIVRFEDGATSGASDPTGGFIFLNAFPYAGGHLLVALGDPRPTLLDHTPRQRAALWRLVDGAAALMRSALEPQGINIGMNQGRAAGAGVPQHLHVHLVPRWLGDTNFITTVGRVRVIPASLEAMRTRYQEAWGKIAKDWGPVAEG
jgi:ATP adenylyltransferase